MEITMLSFSVENTRLAILLAMSEVASLAFPIDLLMP